MATVVMHVRPQFIWTCPNCNKERSDGPVPVELTSDFVGSLTALGMPKEDVVPGRFLQPPNVVVCEDCDTYYETELCLGAH